MGIVGVAVGVAVGVLAGRPHMTHLPLPSSWAPVSVLAYKPWLSEADPQDVLFASINLFDGPPPLYSFSFSLSLSHPQLYYLTRVLWQAIGSTLALVETTSATITSSTSVSCMCQYHHTTD